MIELQFINAILDEQSLSLARQNDINDNYFEVYDDEWRFIVEHYEKYNTVPDETTMLDRFPEFDILEINESNRYLVEELKEEYLFREMSPFIRKLAELAEEDSRKAIEYLKKKMNEFNNLTTFKEGVDLVTDCNDRLEKFKKRSDEEVTGITTGIKELDKITYGWQPEDFVSIIARTSQGKTWLLMYFLVQAWQSGKKVLLYNGELPNDIIGYRFDTLNEHFSNTALNKGQENLEEQYEDYMEELKNKDTPFIVIKPRDINGKLTTTKLRNLIEKYDPDIVGIDQITLMRDERGSKGQPTYIKYEHITEDLYQIAEKEQVPILAPHQANRDAESDDYSNDNIEDADEIKVPSIKNIYGSDAIAHNCRRIITFKKVDKMVKLVVKKNNYGKDNQEILLLWDMDRGVMKPYLTVDNTGDGEDVKQIERKDFF